MKAFLINLATLFCLFCISGAAFKPLAGDEGEMPLWFNLISITFLIVSLLLIFSERKPIVFFLTKNKIFSAVLIYILLSCLWALDPWLSFIAASKYIGAALFGFFLASHFSEKKILSIFATTMVIIIICSFFFALFLPELGMDAEGNWGGAFTSKNLLASRMNLAFITLVLATLHFKKFRLGYIFFAFLAALLIILSRSGTGLVILLLIIFSPLYIPFLRLNGTLIITLALALLCLGGLIYILAGEPNLASLFFIALDKDPTLSGRTETWQGIMYSLTDYKNTHLLFGYGAQNWFFTTHGHIITQSNPPYTITVDNTYMDVLLKYGLVGSALFALVLYQASTLSIKQLKNKTSIIGNLYVVMMVILFINGISESIGSLPFFWTPFALLLASPYINASNKFRFGA